MAFTFTVDAASPGSAGKHKVAWGTWASGVGTDTGGTVTVPLEKTDYFSASGDGNAAANITKAANGRDVVIAHAAAVRSGTWIAWGT